MCLAQVRWVGVLIRVRDGSTWRSRRQRSGSKVFLEHAALQHTIMLQVYQICKLLSQVVVYNQRCMLP